MSLGNLGNIDSVKKITFDTDNTNYLQGINTIEDGLLALDQAVLNNFEGQNDANEINYSNATSGLTPGANVQQAIDTLDGIVDTNTTDITNLDSRLTTAETDINNLELNYPNSTLASAADIKIEYESNADTNAFTDTLLSKLNGIEALATADQTGAEIKLLYEAEANTNAFTDAEKTNLANQSGTNTGDQIASTVPFTTTSTLVSTNVRDAIEEVYAAAPSGTGVSIEDWSSQVVDHDLVTYPSGIQLGVGTAPLDSRSNGGTGTAAALIYTTYGTLGTWNRGRFTCVVDGTYHYKFSMPMSTAGATGTHHYQLVKNGSTIVYNTQYITSGGRTTGAEIDTYLNLISTDYLEVYVGPNHTTTTVPETLFYNVELIVASSAGTMETQQVSFSQIIGLFYGSNDLAAGTATTDPKSLYRQDSNFKLTLTPGKYLISCTQFLIADQGFGISAYLVVYPGTTPTSPTITQVVDNSVHHSSFYQSNTNYSPSIIVDITTTSEVTVWAIPNSARNALWYNASGYSAGADPDNVDIITAVRLVAPSVGDSGSIAYDNSVSGLSSTNLKEAVDEIAADTGAGAMITQQAVYNNSLDQNLNGLTPVSLYEIDSNFKLTLTPGTWLITYFQSVWSTGNNNAYMTLSSTLSSGSADSTAIVEGSIYDGVAPFSGSIVVTPVVTTDYTIWARTNSGTPNYTYYFATIAPQFPDPDSSAVLSAVRLSAPSVGDAGAIVYNNVTSGLTATDVQAAVDEVEGRLDTVEGAYVTTVNGSSGAITNTNIDHDLLTNFVANEHVDHSGVSITGTNGVSGGGDITTNRNLSLDITGLTSDTAAVTNEVAIYNGANKKVTVDSILNSRINYVKFGWSRNLADYAGNTYDSTDWATLSTGPVGANTWIDITNYEDSAVVGTNLSFNSVTGVMTVNTTGTYYLDLHSLMFIDGATNSGLIEIGLNINSVTPSDGSTLIVGVGENGGTNNGSNCANIHSTDILSLTASDTVKLQARWINPTGTRDLRVGYMKVSFMRI